MLYTCKKCGNNNLLADEMYWSGVRTYKCKKCFNSTRKRRTGIKATEKERLYIKQWQLNRLYKITVEQYGQLLQDQNNKCLICDREFDEQIKPVIDHCHRTGKVRGILCSNCNTALGYLREDKVVVQRLLNYLESNTTLIKGEANVNTQQ
jgi:predicted RNA-binding Zn-ribbon protein involved in translation (DUF1610 family)